MADALLHLARGLVGEGHGKDLAREGTIGGEDVGDTGGEYTGFARASACEDEHGAIDGFDRFALFRVEAGEIIGRTGLVAGGHGAGRNAEAAAGGHAWPRCRNWGRGSGRLARRRLFIEEGNVVETVTHAAQCSDSGRKGQ